MEFSKLKYISFDCYGTLINWEAGIRDAVSDVFTPIRNYEMKEILASFAKWESKYEEECRTGGFRSYYDILTDVLVAVCNDFGIEPLGKTKLALANSVKTWKPFSDSVAALQELSKRFKLVILSNIDDEIFAESNLLLQTKFHSVFTAQQIGSYKPNRRNFEYMLEQLGCDKSEILHVAQSIYHDHVPAKAIGLSTLWVNRKSIFGGSGATLPANASPDFVVADMNEAAALIMN